MSKGLEDFKELKKTTCFYCQYHINEECVNDKCIWNNVEKELKEHEQHEEILNDYGLNLCDFREACLLLAMLKGENLNIHDIAKQLKALEILRNKPFVDIYDIQHYDNVEDLNAYLKYMYGYKTTSLLTKEEFELLKEVGL